MDSTCDRNQILIRGDKTERITADMNRLIKILENLEI